MKISLTVVRVIDLLCTKWPLTTCLLILQHFLHLFAGALGIYNDFTSNIAAEDIGLLVQFMSATFMNAVCFLSIAPRQLVLFRAPANTAPLL